jgi:type IV pilus assembly protein PilC
MATATAQARRDVKEYTYLWEGIDRNNRQVRGESRAASETVVTTNLRRQGVRIVKIKRQTFRGGKGVSEKDITFFTRQLATMLKAGVPLLQSFEIIARGHSNPRFSRLMMDIKSKIETGSSMSQAFREHPKHFDALFCNLVQASSTASPPTRKRFSRSRPRSSRRCSIRSRLSRWPSSSCGSSWCG